MDETDRMRLRQKTEYESRKSRQAQQERIQRKKDDDEKVVVIGQLLQEGASVTKMMGILDLKNYDDLMRLWKRPELKSLVKDRHRPEALHDPLPDSPPRGQDRNKMESQKLVNENDVLQSSEDPGPSTAAPIPTENWTLPPRLPAAPSPESISHTIYVRALRSSPRGTVPYFEKGDILRVIDDESGDTRYELLPLRAPNEPGHVFRMMVEAADQEAADAVGRELETEEDKEAFRLATEFDDRARGL